MGLSYRVEVSEAFRVHDGDHSVDTEVHQMDGRRAAVGGAGGATTATCPVRAAVGRGEGVDGPARMTA